jgi:pyrimidine operon attenuation protein/uracil phosphoribosyltransferase
MIPAYIIGLSLNKSVVDIDSFIEDRNAGKGHTRNLKRKVTSPLKAKKILLVDDSYYYGNSLRLAINRIKEAGFTAHILTCIAIILPKFKKNVDIYFLAVPTPSELAPVLWGQPSLN